MAGKGGQRDPRPPVQALPRAAQYSDPKTHLPQGWVPPHHRGHLNYSICCYQAGSEGNKDSPSGLSPRAFFFFNPTLSLQGKERLKKAPPPSTLLHSIISTARQRRAHSNRPSRGKLKNDYDMIQIGPDTSPDILDQRECVSFVNTESGNPQRPN